MLMYAVVTWYGAAAVLIACDPLARQVIWDCVVEYSEAASDTAQVWIDSVVQSATARGRRLRSLYQAH